MTDNNDLLITELKGNQGDLGVITLNRPHALNALTQAMCQTIKNTLDHWEQTTSIKAVIIRGTGDRAFCAGGDIRYLYHMGKENPEIARQFFYYEYRMNHRIFHFKKPYIALMNGITMGGGVGVSIHGSHRVATEKLLLAMPETGIGFIPDIGGSYFLPRCPNYTGFYLGLTGARINAADCYYLGLTNHQIKSEQIDTLVTQLLETAFADNAHQTVTEIIKQFHCAPEPAPLTKYSDEIATCFAHATMEEILHALTQHTNPWCHETARLLMTKSPTCLKVALKELISGKKIHFDDALQMEYRLGQNFLLSHDFYAGIRAVVIDKNQKPNWQPDNLAGVSSDMVNAYFQATGHELSFE